MGDFDGALEDIDRAIELDTAYPDYLLEKGNILARSGQARDAIDYYSKAINIDPENFRYYLERGRTSSQLRRYDDALNDLNRAERLEKDNLPIVYIRATVYTSLGNYDRALNDARKSVELAGENPFVLRQYCWLLSTHPDHAKRQPAKALELMTGIMEAGELTDWQSYETLAATHAANQQFDQAAAKQKKAIELFGDDTDEEMQERLKLYESGKPFVYSGTAWFNDN